MKDQTDIRIIQKTLDKLSSLSNIINGVEDVCKRYGLSFSVEFEEQAFYSQSHVVRRIEGMTSFEVLISCSTISGLGGFGTEFSSHIEFRETSRIYFCYGPIICALYFIAHDSETVPNCYGRIIVATRGLHESSKSCTRWRMEIDVLSRMEQPGEEGNVTVTFKEYIDKIGKFKNNHGASNIKDSLHLILSYLAIRHVRILSLMKQLSDDRLSISDCLAVWEINEVMRNSTINWLESLADSSLKSFLASYFLPTPIKSFRDIYNNLILSSFEKESNKITPGNPFDFLKIIFQLLAVVIKEMEIVDEEIKKICGDRYDAVVRSILFLDNPLDPKNDVAWYLPLIIPLDNIHELTLSELDSYWKERIESIGARIGNRRRTLYINLSFEMPLSTPQMFAEYSNAYLTDALESYFEKEKDFLFRNTYRKAEDDIGNRLFSSTLDGILGFSSSHYLTPFNLECYSKSFHNFCKEITKYFRSSFKS